MRSAVAPPATPWRSVAALAGLLLACSLTACADTSRADDTAPATSDAVAVARLPLGERGHWPPAPTVGHVEVVISRDAILVDGTPVVALEDGRIPADLLAPAPSLVDRAGNRGHVVPTLAVALDQAAALARHGLPAVAPRTAEARAQARRTSCFPERDGDTAQDVALLPYIDADVPWQTVLHLATTGLSVDLDFPGPVARMPETRAEVAPWRPSGVALLPLPLTCSSGALEAASSGALPPLTAEIAPQQLVVGGGEPPPAVIGRDGEDAWRMLYNEVQRRDRDRTVAPAVIELSIAASTPLGDVVRAADAAALHRAPRGSAAALPGMTLPAGTSLREAELVEAEVKLPRGKGRVRVAAELRRATIPLAPAPTRQLANTP